MELQYVATYVLTLTLIYAATFSETQKIDIRPETLTGRRSRDIISDTR